MAMACLRLFTFPPLPAFPERSVPFFLRRIALSTFFFALSPYLRAEALFFFAGIIPPLPVISPRQVSARLFRYGF
jgi:hypothetical protein